jgi:hypothetical protein
MYVQTTDMMGTAEEEHTTHSRQQTADSRQQTADRDTDSIFKSCCAAEYCSVLYDAILLIVVCYGASLN